ncbi:hypothetical protein J5N97_011842 [Dioscorea zingiberensis]|uniref:Uncharacterized protein n=1 Tax=Dioscorea zingiberensis TaxID=325984 RepID=A0A9D5D357_9LILI|nr:hypothetical protein J5N97_011842 [Dioscorea zingiberensis]
MEGRSVVCFSIPVLAFFVMIFVSIQANFSSAATDSISAGQSLSGKQTIVSEDGTFELGFFTPGVPKVLSRRLRLTGN